MREKVRSGLAIGLLVLLATVLLTLVGFTVGHEISTDTAKELAAVILTPLIALTGTALGFYFGGHHTGS